MQRHQVPDRRESDPGSRHPAALRRHPAPESVPDPLSLLRRHPLALIDDRIYRRTDIDVLGIAVLANIPPTAKRKSSRRT